MSKDWGEKEFGWAETNRWMNFTGANGSEIEHYGSRNVLVTAPF